MVSNHHWYTRSTRAVAWSFEGNTRVSFFDLVFLIFGVIGVLGGAWPLLSGRNFPGLLGRGFTRRDDLKLQRAPTIYFRATGATIVSFGVLIFCIGTLIW